ncbi:hypothetical protein V8C86DRAFT_2589411 [Haematococcus lacustris]
MWREKPTWSCCCCCSSCCCSCSFPAAAGAWQRLASGEGRSKASMRMARRRRGRRCRSHLAAFPVVSAHAISAMKMKMATLMATWALLLALDQTIARAPPAIVKITQWTNTKSPRTKSLTCTATPSNRRPAGAVANLSYGRAKWSGQSAPTPHTCPSWPHPLSSPWTCCLPSLMNLRRPACPTQTTLPTQRAHLPLQQAAKLTAPTAHPQPA